MKDFRLNDNDNIEENMSFNPDISNKKVFDEDGGKLKNQNTERPQYQRGVPRQYTSMDPSNRESRHSDDENTAHADAVNDDREARRSEGTGAANKIDSASVAQQKNMNTQNSYDSFGIERQKAHNDAQQRSLQGAETNGSQRREQQGQYYNQYGEQQNVQKQRMQYTDTARPVRATEQPVPTPRAVSQENPKNVGRTPQSGQAPQYAQPQQYRQSAEQRQDTSFIQPPVQNQPAYNGNINGTVPNSTGNASPYASQPSAFQPYRQENYIPKPTHQAKPAVPPTAMDNSAHNGGVPVNVGRTPDQNGYYGYNGMIPENPTAPDRNKKKRDKKEKKKTKNAGLTAVLIIVAVICVALIGTLAVLSSYIVLNNNGVITDSSDTYSDTATDGSWGIGNNTDITDPNNNGLNINSQPEINVNEYSAQHAYEVLSPSVVGISCFEKALTEVDDGPESEGTGIIVTQDGYIATNSHVIGDSKSAYEVYVTLSNGNEYEAKIVGFDTKTDLAVLKINASSLTPATFGDSEALSVGQEVVAIGNPGGSEYSNSITKGIISAVNRSVSTFSYVNYIQTDAAINPGNSGGPLANLYGQVIGINTIKIVDEEYEGMGFAIPSVTVKDICDDIIKQGYVSDRVRIGITGQEISAAASASYNLPGGILIVSFSSDSPFRGTQAKPDDIITKFNGVEISSFSELYKELDKYKPGDEVKVTLYRASGNGTSGKTFDVTIKLLADLGETQNVETVD